ncbi:hypothetical protein [Sphingomonas nostoxanthinifaciens]|uniref:hypothetical protein n=1 Tax=Sphingomonas nostoxanthinifaciens TaxID=2872652 RepID=UPI001CC1C6B9|nr:hypothetical protein [Sphingomonas nostoxanthinifaciens]UAK25394.1 hypothetical protein K8P63_04230 [Sphingomonas nostoxanthinifaciens]
MRLRLLLAALVTFVACPALAENAPFDLAGPSLRVSVTHAGRTLPIAQVPQLASGDRIDVRADLPPDQSAHYLLVTAFLRGATNPPPDKWFAQVETWTKKGKRGLSLTVPEGAQQVMLFLAPETGGDFPTLRNAVQGKPGAFVRAAQDLAQASLDQRRLDAYLVAVRQPAPGDPGRLERITPLLARSLQIKVNADCLSKTPELQAPCLLQNQDALVLNDGHSNAITDALSGPGVDLALQFSATPQGGLGYYSPYIAAIRDIIGLFGSIHTAKYQYIPALATPEGDRMGLILNAAPSFHNPKSVLVAALPIVAPVRIPPLDMAEPDLALCAQADTLVLPAVGAPLIYATDYAHDLALRVDLPGGRTVDLPIQPDVERGGLVVHVAGALPKDLDAPAKATIHGQWGFQPFDGPVVRLEPARIGGWRLAGPPRDGVVELTGGAAACVTHVTAGGRDVTWKRIAPDRIGLPLDPRAGATIAVASAGAGDPQRIEVAAPPAPARFTATVIARHVERPAQVAPIAVVLGSDMQVPGDATLRISLRAGDGMRFTGRETVEVAAGSGGDTARLTVANGLTIADPQVALATIQPASALGASAFGPLRARIVRDGIAGDWLPIGTLVRLPAIRQLHCPDDPAAQACELSGDNLFLIAAVAPTAAFDHPVAIPEGYPGTSIQVPRPAGGALYVRWHDDPAIAGHIGG